MAAHLWAQSLTCWAKVVGTVVIAGPGGQENFIGPTFRSHRPKRETEDDIPNLDRGIRTVTFQKGEHTDQLLQALGVAWV